jgi:hypothetical protein
MKEVRVGDDPAKIHPDFVAFELTGSLTKMISVRPFITIAY